MKDKLQDIPSSKNQPTIYAEESGVENNEVQDIRDFESSAEIEIPYSSVSPAYQPQEEGEYPQYSNTSSPGYIPGSPVYQPTSPDYPAPPGSNETLVNIQLPNQESNESKTQENIPEIDFEKQNYIKKIDTSTSPSNESEPVNILNIEEPKEENSEQKEEEKETSNAETKSVKIT